MEKVWKRTREARKYYFNTIIMYQEETLLNEKMFELLDFIPVPIYLKDIQGYYLSCNTLFSDMFNVKKEDVVGKNVYDFLDMMNCQSKCATSCRNT